ncbi:MAG: GNAT family N-acetyltransferase [Rhizobiales bacterium]|nr:GNAT family N-acetyltransferase [Hyphomicrobiales bacterium]
MNIQVRRLKAEESEVASAVTKMMAGTFEEGQGSSGARLAELLANEQFWFFGAFDADLPVGGLTAHVLPITRENGDELFVYDIAVVVSHQRRGIGRRLMQAAIAAAHDAGLLSTFVPADNEDQHALDFYQGIGGLAQSVTIFTFA